MRHLRNVRGVLASIWYDESNNGQRFYRLFIAMGWQIWKRLVGTPVVVRLFNGFRFLAYPDCQCSSGVFYTRIPNCKHIEFLREQSRGGTFVDIGANVGLVTILLADTIQHAMLFEPNHTAAARARENMAINQLVFDIYEIALSDQNGTVEFENAGGVSTCNRVVLGFVASVPTHSVPRRTFDDFRDCHSALRPPITVKVDVEGHENSVFRGMESFLRTARPKLLMFEYLQRTNLSETQKFFGGVGYRVFELAGAGPIEASENTLSQQDLFACPEESWKEFVR